MKVNNDIQSIKANLSMMMDFLEIKHLKIVNQEFETAAMYRDEEVKLQSKLITMIHLIRENKIPIKLFLDDERWCKEDEILVKDYRQFTYFVKTFGLPDFISFDHDLGLEESGYDCAKWLVNYCLDNNFRLPKFDVHSQNPIGKENILSLLQNFEKNIKG